MPKVSIIIPVIRPESAERCIRLAKENTNVDIEFVIDEDKERIGAPLMVKRLVEKANSDLVCFLGDDAIPEKGFLEEALKAIERFQDSVGLIGFNDDTGRTLPTHWLGHKKLLPMIGGEFFHTGYYHCYCDKELKHRCKVLNRYHYCIEAIVFHDNPVLRGEEPTGDYERIYSEKYLKHDYDLYESRKKQWERTMKVGLCLPIAQRNVDRSFFLSFLRMDKPWDCTIYFPRMEIYGFIMDIADARNDLVQQALNEQCTHIIMMDTDQIYREDTLTKLMSHDLSVVGAMVHRRYPPFAPLLYRGKIGHYKYVPEDEMFSGELVEVDATGCGCVCYKSEVFEKVKYKWYEIKNKENGEPVGEDVRFCSRLRVAGIKIHVDTSATVDHMTTFAINQKFFEAYKLLNIGRPGASSNKEKNDE